MIFRQYKIISLWLRLFVLVALVIAAGYYFRELGERGRGLPPIPEVAVDEFSAPVQTQILDAQTRLRSAPEDADLNARLGMVLHAYKLLPPATVCYKRARALDNGNYATAYFLGIAQLQAGQNREAIENLRAAMELKPDYRPARLRLAEALNKGDELQEARLLYETLLQENPDAPWAQYGLGQVMAAQDNQEAAIAHYRQAVDLHGAFGPAHYALALAYRDRGDSERAADHMESYRRYQKQTPPHADPLLQSLDELDISATALVRRARQQENSGRAVDALQTLEAAVAREPDSVEAHSQLVRLYHLFNDLNKAEQHYRAATAIQPGAVMANLQFGTFLAEKGQYAEAATAFGKVLEANPDHADANTLLGQAYDELQRPQAAAAHYHRALASDPNHRHANFLLGRNLLLAGQVEEATAYLEKTTHPVDEGTSQFLYQIAMTLHSAGQREQAIGYLQRAYELALVQGQAPLAGEYRRTLTQWDEAEAE